MRSPIDFDIARTTRRLLGVETFEGIARHVGVSSRTIRRWLVAETSPADSEVIGKLRALAVKHDCLVMP